MVDTLRSRTVHSTLLSPGPDGTPIGSWLDSSRTPDPSPMSESTGSHPGSRLPNLISPGSCLHHREATMRTARLYYVQSGDGRQSDLLDGRVVADS